MSDLVYAEMTTEHYTFRAIGQDRRGALQNIIEAWGEHMRQVGREKWERQWFDELPAAYRARRTMPWDWYDVAYWDFSGDIVGYRDDNAIVRK